MDFVQKSCQKLTTKGGGQDECQKFARYNCSVFLYIQAFEATRQFLETLKTAGESLDLLL